MAQDKHSSSKSNSEEDTPVAVKKEEAAGGPVYNIMSMAIRTTGPELEQTHARQNTMTSPQDPRLSGKATTRAPIPSRGSWGSSRGELRHDRNGYYTNNRNGNYSSCRK